MTFEVSGNIAKIDGKQGKYDNSVTNPSVRYGRNAVENYYTYLEQPIVSDSMTSAPILELGASSDTVDRNTDKINQFLKENDEYLKALPPLEFEYRYMPNMVQKGQIDKMAVLGAAYEEMGKVNEMSVKELDERFAPDSNFTSAALDVNKDGKIDIAEYGSSILAADMLSKSPVPDTANIDGTINKKGFDAVLAYTQKSNAAAAAAMYAKINDTYNLAEAKKEFKPE